MVLRSTCLWVLVCFQTALHAQEFGGNRFSTRWQQINTDTVRVIFPKGLDSAATRVGSLVHGLAGARQLSLGGRLKKIDIVLQNSSVVSNGYVGLAPYRSEFYLTPSPDNFEMGSLDWLDKLTLHEYRHVQQYNNFYHGASKALRYLAGEEGYALATNAAIPNWFFEGDAVFQETVLSRQGRGRIPSFLKAYPALWAADKKYSWMKLRNGSLKDYTPNHYDLGYLLVNYGAGKYGKDFWGNVVRSASAFTGGFYPMQKAVKRYTGISYKTFIKNAFDFYKQVYDEELALKAAPKPDKKYTSYFNPYMLAPDSLLYLKTSYSKRPAFVVRDAVGEHVIRLRDISLEEEFGYRNGKIVYTAYRTHPRWRGLSFSVINILDINTRRQKTLGRQTRYFTPDLSPSGKYVVANEVEQNGGSRLAVLDAHNGGRIAQLKYDEITYFVNPKFANDSTVVAVLRNKEGANFMGQIAVDNGSLQPLTPATFNTMGGVFVSGDSIFFTASHGLRDDIFCMDIKTHQLFKLKTADLTSYYPNSSNGTITWSSFTAGGYRLRQKVLHEATWEAVQAGSVFGARSGVVAEKDTAAENFLTGVPNRDFTISTYKKLSHPFNFHSWRPFYENPLYSFTLYGNNVLNTVTTNLEYVFNENEKSHALGGSIVYGGLFPYITAGATFTFNRQDSVLQKLRAWNQWDSYAGLSIPLNWVSGRTAKALTFGANYVYRAEINKGLFKDTVSRQYGYLYHYLSWGQQVQKARQDIFPKFGYNLQSQYRYTTSFYSAWQWLNKVNLYLPGAFAANHLVLTAAWQRAGTGHRVFANNFPYSRGYLAVYANRLVSATANYHFPIAYPDWGFGNLLYVQRVRGNVFYDYTKIHSTPTKIIRELQSAGAEVFLDTKWWNSFPVTIGMRAGYFVRNPLPQQKNKFFLEWVLPVSLIP